MNLERRLAVAFVESHPTQAAMALERMPAGQRQAVLQGLPVAVVARAVERMTTPLASDAVSRLAPDEAARLVDALEIEVSSALLRRLEPEAAARIVGVVPEPKQEVLRRVLRYPTDSAGALMDPVVPALPDDVQVAEARLRLRRGAPGLQYYLYVVDRDRRLVGVLALSELVRARSTDAIRTLMHEPVESLSAWTPAAAVRTHPGWQRFHSLPVVDDAGCLVGAIQYQTLRHLERTAETGAVRPEGPTIAALGELFRIGMAGFVEGISGVAVPRAKAGGGLQSREERDA